MIGVISSLSFLNWLALSLFLRCSNFSDCPPDANGVLDRNEVVHMIATLLRTNSLIQGNCQLVQINCWSRKEQTKQTFDSPGEASKAEDIETQADQLFKQMDSNQDGEVFLFLIQQHTNGL